MTPFPILDAAFYTSILDGLYADLEALDTTGYQADAVDRWKSSRTGEPDDGHLRAWIDLGEEVEFTKPLLTFQGAVVFSSRYQVANDCAPQGRIHAAATHVFQMLQAFRGPGDTRCLPSGWTLARSPKEGWALVEVPFRLLLPLTRSA